MSLRTKFSEKDIEDYESARSEFCRELGQAYGKGLIDAIRQGLLAKGHSPSKVDELIRTNSGEAHEVLGSICDIEKEKGEIGLAAMEVGISTEDIERHLHTAQGRAFLKRLIARMDQNKGRFDHGSS